MRSPKRAKSKKPASHRRPAGMKRRGGRRRTPKTHLLNPKVSYGSRGKIESITGTCSEPGCSNERTIKPQDAFQVRRCVECQKKATRKRTAK